MYNFTRSLFVEWLSATKKAKQTTYMGSKLDVDLSVMEIHHHMCLSLSDTFLANIPINTQYHGVTNHVVSYNVYINK